MSNETPAPVPFDLVRIKELVALMEQHGLTEVDLQHGEQRWKLRRGPAEVTQVVHGGGYPMAAMQMPMGQMPMAQMPSPQAQAPASPPAATADSGMAIKSPTVGTFYSSGAPGEEPYAKVGTKVTRDSVVCIIEAMKVMNHITADLEGTITEVLAKNGDAVEFNQPLFRVKVG